MVRLLVLSRYPEGTGGGIFNLIEVLKKNFSKDIVCFHFQIGEKNYDRRGNRGNFFIIMLDCVSLLKKLKVNKCNLIILNTNLNLKSLLRDGFYMFILTIMGYRKVIIFFHGWYNEVEVRINKNHLFCFLFRWLFNRATLILVLASRFRKSLATMGFDPLKIRLITTMFDGKIFNGIKHNSNQKMKTILFLSRFIREKGIYELLEAFEIISKKSADLKLIMAGDGPELNKMKAWVEKHHLSDRVNFPGFLSGIEKIHALVSADLFVLPTYYGEGCPIALLEAMAAGLPIITTPAGGIPDIFRNNENGILLDSVTAKSIVLEIEHLIEDSSFCEQIEENNYRKAWDNYEASIVTKKIEIICKEIGGEKQTVQPEDILHE